MPDIKAVHENRGTDSFNVLAINTGETRSRAMDFIDFIKAPFTWGLDFDLTVTDAYGVGGLPKTFYVDANGVVRAAYAGQSDKARLTAYIEAAFEGSAPPDLPPSLRPVSSIPRDHVLSIEAKEPGLSVFTSRALRCDPAYCADTGSEKIRALAGVLSVENGVSAENIPTLLVRFDEKAIPAADVTNAVVATLQALVDPVYTTPLEIRSIAP